VKKLQYVMGAIILGATLALAGCQHRLVARGGDTTVAVYPDRDSFEKLKHLQSEGGPAGMLGGLGTNFVAKKVDNGAPVKVLASDDDGYTIEVLDGASKGMRGYVSKDNVD